MSTTCRLSACWKERRPLIPTAVRRWLGLDAVARSRLVEGSLQHDGERFRNVAPAPVEGLGKMLGIVWNMLLHKPKDTVPAGPIPVDTLTRAALVAAPDQSMYRLGHSTLLFKLQGQFWLTDPVFGERASPFRSMGPRRFHAPPIALDELPPLPPEVRTQVLDKVRWRRRRSRLMTYAAVGIAAAMLAASVTSIAMASASKPSPCSTRAASVPFSSVRAPMMTWTSCRASWRAVSKPMPRVAPVTRAIFRVMR